MKAEVVVNAGAAHGEGPVWDARTERLYWVDLTGKALHATNVASGADRVIEFDDLVCAIAPCAGGGLVAALNKRIVAVAPATGETGPVAVTVTERPDVRCNDGKCGPDGRFWIGTMSLDGTVEGAGALFRVDPDGRVCRMLDNLTISNGMAWSLDGRTMYFIDTPAMEVWAFDFDAEAGEISNRRTAVAVPKDTGFPDGMTIDVEGMLWVAHWGGGRVCRWDPRTGKRLAEVELPVQNVSSCAFGGADLDVLYITTSRLGLDEEVLSKEPLAGGLFRARPGVRGMPTDVFGK